MEVTSTERAVPPRTTAQTVIMAAQSLLRPPVASVMAQARGAAAPMGASSVFAEVYTWRITAVVLWGGALAFWAAAVWSLDWSIALTPLRLLAAPWRLLSPLGEAPAWVLGALVAASCAPLLAMHVVLLRTTEPLPLPGATASAASHSSLLALLCRAGGRLRTLADTARTAAFVLACAVTGSLFMGLFPLVKASSHGQGREAPPPPPQLHSDPAAALNSSAALLLLSASHPRRCCAPRVLPSTERTTSTSYQYQ